jgi:hypothetical protein
MTDCTSYGPRRTPAASDMKAEESVHYDET